MADQDNIDLYGPDETNLYDDSDDEPAVEDALKAEPSSSQPPSSAGLPPLPSFKKIPPTSTTASSTTTDETHALGNEVVMSEPNAPGPAVTAGQASDASTRPSDMPDEGKMFIGGLNWETTDETLRTYFAQFGPIDHCTIMRDPTGRSRGFAFLTYHDKASVDRVVAKDVHTVDNKIIDPKRAIPHQEHKKAAKVFIGGLLPSTTTEVVKQFFASFGTVLDAQVMVDRESSRSKGFGFVTFADESSCEKCLALGMVEIEGKQVEVKKAQPRTGRGQEQQAQLNPMGLALGLGGPSNKAGPQAGGQYRPQPMAPLGGLTAMNGGMPGMMGAGAGGMGNAPGMAQMAQMGGMGMGMGGGPGGMGMGAGGFDPMAMVRMYQMMNQGMGGGMGMMGRPMMNPGMGAVNPAFQQNAMMGMNAMGGGASPSGAAGGAGGVSGNGAVGGAAAGGGASPNTGTGTVRPQMNPMMGMGMGGMNPMMGMGMNPMMMNPMMGMNMGGMRMGGMMGMPMQGGQGAGAGGAAGGSGGPGGRSPAGAAGATQQQQGMGPARSTSRGQNSFRPY